ncbi:MAG: hypothetical protein CMF69_00560 [Magnetovibrio sp.]|nr:hypothetical protein [Magnetovibrio sp.]
MDKPVNISNDITIHNGYPDTDSILVIQTNNTWNISIWRDEDQSVHVSVYDNVDGSQTDLVLGEEGYTQKC